MSLTVKYLDLPQQFRDEALHALLQKQFETCQFVMGPEVEVFERNFAALCRTPYAIGLNSGTDALFLALKALGLGPGDEVITAPNSFVASTGAIIAVGSRPVFVDVTADYNIDANLIEGAITEKTRAILPIHLTGNPADMEAIMKIARKHTLFVVEDAAQAVMASINGKRVGSFGDAGCFSLHPLKNLNACGDGGVLTANSQELYNRVRLLRNHGLKNRDEIEMFGYNSRLDTLQAVVANYVLGQLRSITDRRVRNAHLYDGLLQELSDFVVIPPRRERVRQVFHTYVIRVKKRDDLARFLNDHNVETKIHYPIPIHFQKPCEALGYRKGDFPVCEAQAKEILSLPVHHHLTEEQIGYVVELIKKFYS
jgi:dTDP-4-amino-4,6-dideoxygalactose transaminase